MDSTKKIYIFLVITALVIVLIYAQGIIIPFILSVLFWFMIRVVKKVLSKIRFVKAWPKWLLTAISSVIMLSFLFFTVEMISVNIGHLTKTLPVYEENVNKVTQLAKSEFDIDLSGMLSDFSKDLNFGEILSKIFSTLTSLFGNASMVLIYLIFLLVEESTFPNKLKAMYPDSAKHEKMKTLVRKIDKSVSNYIALKTLVSLLTGFLSYFVLLFVGVDAPAFWAFLIFVLNFIPTIGSLIATIFPTIFALLQFGEFTPAILVLVIVGAIQLVVGNIIEPRLMGNSLNISPLVVLLTLTMWGFLWGVVGMLLSVPITVILIIIMSEFEGTKPIAILLSRQGKIGDQ
ncbi:Predicted PurR-regulated permease PerM [Mariniphaga anaerophila]|uniref:Predicted PurR-regulated permease PerM n=1 Tax=Mariniphaga anaerophila TaxID=1484053 RepID=A0A1M5DM61_9BACT|nr:AI-2E family transporter [Mariniphaga anaerophila]SHF68089.1 Predicted PurR-regulated permease PerM [Mariniphaga anaerophila]